MPMIYNNQPTLYHRVLALESWDERRSLESGGRWRKETGPLVWVCAVSFRHWFDIVVCM